jgi:ATP-dependent helicase Lhr and Lhr-like helicase
MIQPALDWFSSNKWKAFPFQVEAWEAYLAGKSGLVNAPTGSGKTYSLLMPILLEFLRDHPNKPTNSGLRAIWITPIRALSKEIQFSAERAIEALDVPWQIGVRTGDTSLSKRTRQRVRPPEFLITTPESLHLLLASKGYAEYFADLRTIVVDEWHELIGSKRGVQIELALSRLRTVAPNLKVWGISATIGNMDQALEVLMGADYKRKHVAIIRAKIKKEMEIVSVLPDELERMPWSGHLGVHMVKKVIPILNESHSTLIFTNVRFGAEIWYQKLLEVAPELSGVMAMHHSAISQQLRTWVEEQLHEGNLKAVVCTSSLDLGVDFRPVETVVQVGSPKGVARFLQRAGRSGHQPGATSRIFFLPTNSLELIEASALREAMHRGIIEERIPYVRSFDVLIQYLITLAVSDGFRPKEIYEEIRTTFSFNSVTQDEFDWLLRFITTGGQSLTAYDEYRKVEVEDGVYKVVDRRIAQRHRLSIGTIVGDASVLIKFLSGKYIGSIEEYFIAQLNPGDVFWFAGRSLELVRVKDMEAQVRKSNKKSGRIPSWQGGRMPLSSLLSDMIRLKVDEAAGDEDKDAEMKFIRPLMNLQRKYSHLPRQNEFLVEYFETSEGHHVMMYPFEGRNVHEGMAALVAYRISKIQPITFSIAMNDYGFELLSDQEVPIYEAIETDVLGIDNLRLDIQASINSTEMAKRKFRDIAAISGLVFKGYPGKPIKDRHLQSNSQLFFDVFHQYESTNLLLLQAYEEVMDFQLEETRLRRALSRIAKQRIIVKEPGRPTPFSFPIIVDGMREKLTSEKLEDRIKKMLVKVDE